MADISKSKLDQNNYNATWIVTKIKRLIIKTSQ